MKRHPLDPFSLVFGATLGLLGIVFLFTRVDIAKLHLRWAWPIPVIVLGALIIALGSRRELGSRRDGGIDRSPETDRIEG